MRPSCKEYNSLFSCTLLSFIFPAVAAPSRVCGCSGDYTAGYKPAEGAWTAPHPAINCGFCLWPPAKHRCPSHGWVKTSKVKCFTCSLPSGFYYGIYLRTPFLGGAVLCSPSVRKRQKTERWEPEAWSIKWQQFDSKSVPGHAVAKFTGLAWKAAWFHK